jgi:hypothetical protein
VSRLSRLILAIMGFGVLSVEVAALAFVRRSDALYIAAVVMGIVFVVCSGYAWTLTLRRVQDVDGLEGLWSLAWVVYWVVFIAVFFGLLPGIIQPR